MRISDWSSDVCSSDLRLHRSAPRVEVVGVGDEAHLDAELGERVVQEVVGAAVEGGRGHDVVAGVGQVQDREGGGGLVAGDRQGAGDAERGVGRAPQRGHARLQNRLGGRSAERRWVKECDSKSRSLWSTYNSKQKTPRKSS